MCVCECDGMKGAAQNQPFDRVYTYIVKVIINILYAHIIIREKEPCSVVRVKAKYV